MDDFPFSFPIMNSVISQADTPARMMDMKRTKVMASTDSLISPGSFHSLLLSFIIEYGSNLSF
jgi:hypothetical protein